MEFRQFATNFDRFKFIIEDSGIRLIKKRIASSTDTFVDFESIGSKIIIEKLRNPLWIIISLVFLAIAISVLVGRLRGGKVGDNAEFFSLSISLFFFMIFMLTQRSMIFLTQSDNTNAIEFIGTNRYKKRVYAFISELLEKRNEYLIEKYSSLNEFLPYNQQYNGLVWLYNLKILTQEELSEKVAELNEITFGSDNLKKEEITNPIGFKSYNISNENSYEGDDE